MKLLDRARNLMRGLAPLSPPPPQAFHLACPLGHPLSGERTEGYQAIPCPTCGEAVFVLPRSPLPEPPPRTPPRTPAPAPPGRAEGVVVAPDGYEAPREGDGYEIDAEIQWDDPPVEPEPEPRAERPEAPARPRRTGETRRPKPVPARPRPADERTPPAPEEETAPARPVGERFGAWARRNRHPLWFLGVALVVAGSIGYRVRWSRRQDLPRVAELGRTQGLEALDAGRFDAAHQLLSQARKAVDALGGAYEGAQEIRQGADEAAIIVGLCPTRPELMLAEATQSDPESWASRFDTLYKGRSILVDALVVAVPDPKAGRDRYDLDYRVVPDGETDRRPPVGLVDLSGLRIFELTRPAAGSRVRFGARLASFRFDPASETWLIGLEPSSGAWITHPRALEALGWPSPDEPPPEAAP